MRHDEPRRLCARAATAALVVLCLPVLGMRAVCGLPAQDILEVQLRWPHTGTSTIPFSRGVNHILIEVVGADGKAFTFVVDTGASLSVVTPEFVGTSGTRELSTDTAAHAYGASGRIEGSPRLVRVQDLSIGGLVVEDAAAVVMDLATISEGMGIEVHGIIGYNLLSRMTTIVDYPESRISFVRPDTEGPKAQLGPADVAVPFDLLAGALITVSGTVDSGPPTEFIVDLGSRLTVLNRPASESSGIEFVAVDDQPPALGLGSEAGSAVASGRAGSLRIGDLEIAAPELYSVALPVFSTLGVADRNAGLLGNDLLGRYIVAIDYAARRLLFWSPSS